MECLSCHIKGIIDNNGCSTSYTTLLKHFKFQCGCYSPVFVPDVPNTGGFVWPNGVAVVRLESPSTVISNKSPTKQMSTNIILTKGSTRLMTHDSNTVEVFEPVEKEKLWFDTHGSTTAFHIRVPGIVQIVSFSSLTPAHALEGLSYILLKFQTFCGWQPGQSCTNWQ